MNELGAKGEPFVFIIDFLKEKPLLFLPDELDQEDIRIDIPGLTNFERRRPGASEFYFRKFPVDFNTYRNAFEKVLTSIRRGDTFLLNLTFPTLIETSLSLDDIFHLSRAKYRLKLKDRFVVFSPEPFVVTRKNSISTFPMKGTIDAGIERAEEKLMNDPKEIAEHNTIVDLLRNDLNMVSEKVRVEKFRFIEEIRTHEKTILQTSTSITGQLSPDWQNRIGDILFRMLPAGSICGAPKRKTVEIIREIEMDDRGYFTGVFGYFNGSELNSAVMIRFIERRDDGLYFRSGGGITHFSECQKEYRELIDKVYVPVIHNDQP